MPALVYHISSDSRDSASPRRTFAAGLKVPAQRGAGQLRSDITRSWCEALNHSPGKFKRFRSFDHSTACYSNFSRISRSCKALRFLVGPAPSSNVCHIISLQWEWSVEVGYGEEKQFVLIWSDLYWVLVRIWWYSPSCLVYGTFDLPFHGQSEPSSSLDVAKRRHWAKPGTEWEGWLRGIGENEDKKQEHAKRKTVCWKDSNEEEREESERTKKIYLSI
jgi:hypothetical protein